MTPGRGQGIVSASHDSLVVSLSNAAVTFPTTVPLIPRPPHLHPGIALGKARRHLIAVIALLCFLSQGLPRADAAETMATLASDTGTPGTNDLPAGLQLNRLEPAAQPTMASRWWFWTAVGAVVVATATVIIASSAGSGPPTTSLGNQVFAP